MKKIYWGLFFVVLTVNLQTYVKSMPDLDLLPDCIGYVLIYLGLREVRSFSPRLRGIGGVVIAALVLSTLDFILCVIGDGMLLEELAVLVLRLYIMYQIAAAYAELPSIQAHGERMRHCWKRYMGLMVVVFVGALLLIPVFLTENWVLIFGLGFVVLIMSIVGFVYGICYLIAANRAANEYVPDEILSIERENGENRYDA